MGQRPDKVSLIQSSLQTKRTWDVRLTIDSFVVAFTLPYLLNAPYAALGAKVGFIFGPIAITACIWAFCKSPRRVACLR
jgi:SP family sugar:H+ symporter-like MFS transporter